MSDAPLRLTGVWKSYPDAPVGGRRRLLRRPPRRWVLRDIGFAVAPGSALGVIGPNGAGKSTLLRVACGLSPADRGGVQAQHGIVSVLTLGDLLDPELSGAENAYSAGILAGLPRARARAQVADILAFAELEADADRPVRTYSDGMRLRLAFAGATVTDPRALVMDEVIAVGDARFQARCLERVDELRRRGTAVVMASHDLDLVARTCDEAVWLHDGAVELHATAGEVVEAYRRRVREQTAALTPDGDPALRTSRFGSQEVTVDDVVLLDADGGPCAALSAGAPLTVSGRIRPHTARGSAVLTVGLRRDGDEHPLFELSTESARVLLDLDRGEQDFALSLDRLDLAPGRWWVDLGLWEPGWTYAYDYHWRAHRLDITGVQGGRGAALPPHSWRIGRRPAGG